MGFHNQLGQNSMCSVQAIVMIVILESITIPAHLAHTL